MAEEEKNEQEGQVEEPQPGEAAEVTAENPEEGGEEQAEDAGADDAPAEEAPAEEAPAEDAGADEALADEAPAVEPGAGAESEEAGEAPSPKQLRKRRRSQFTGPARPQLDPEERAGERAEARRRNAAERRRRRASRRGRRGEPATGTPPAERGAGPKKVRTGTVVSTKAAKTITVRIEVTRRHPTYEKVVRRSATLHAHDENGQAQEGDVVRVIESRPLSRTKRWRLVEVLERAR